LQGSDGIIIDFTACPRNAATAAKASLIARTRSIENLKSIVIATNFEISRTGSNNEANYKPNGGLTSRIPNSNVKSENDPKHCSTNTSTDGSSKKYPKLKYIAASAQYWSSFHSEFIVEFNVIVTARIWGIHNENGDLLKELKLEERYVAKTLQVVSKKIPNV